MAKDIEYRCLNCGKVHDLLEGCEDWEPIESIPVDLWNDRSFKGKYHITDSGVSGYEIHVSQRAKRITEEIESPRERRKKLIALKEAIKKSPISTRSWDGIAIEMINTGIERATIEIEDQQGQVGDKIDLWIAKNIPNSPNKDIYKEVFELIVQHPAPKDCTYTDLLDHVRTNLDPKISDQSLRKRIAKFVPDLPL